MKGMLNDKIVSSKLNSIMLRKADYLEGIWGSNSLKNRMTKHSRVLVKEEIATFCPFDCRKKG